ncbi:MAG: DUF2809 domain-containing protein [Myxococcota bacterium]
MRSRRILVVAAGVTVALGLASRLPGAPPFVVAYVGDALYAVLIYWLLAFVRPGAPVMRLALAAWATCALIEASQAWHPAWLDALRAHRLVALVLGRGFLWSDLGCYAVGVLAAGAVDRAIRGAGR